MQPISVIVDCDNTLGVRYAEIDDGLAILTLLAQPRVTVTAVTTAFGNGTVDQALLCTRALLERVTMDPGRPPVYRGAAHAGDTDTPAARALAHAVAERPGQITVIALGPLTNIAAAAALDPAFFGNVAGIVCMGGYERPLRFARRPVAELNLSADARAAATVLEAPCRVALMSAQLCLQAQFAPRHLAALWLLPPWLAGAILEWFTVFSYRVGSAGFYLWDLVPVLYALEPGRFIRRRVHLTVTGGVLATGRLVYTPAGSTDAGLAGVVELPVRIRRAWRIPGQALFWLRSATRASAGRASSVRRLGVVRKTPK